MIIATLTTVQLFRRFARCKSATAAIEFAITVPTLAAAVVGLSDASTLGVQASKMQSGVRASIQYVMNGGTSMDVARTQGLQAWSDRPYGATMTVTQACICGGTTGTCGTVCGDGTVPSRYVTAVAAGTLGGEVLHYNKTVTESVRIQ